MRAPKPVAISCFLAACLVAPAARAENLLHIADGGFRAPWPIDLWGIEVADWKTLADQPDVLYERMQEWAFHGVNAVGISLQGERGAGRFFAPDGASVEPDAAKAFSSFAFRLRDHHFGLIVNLFSSDPGSRLASAEAYDRAAESVIKLLGERHSCVFVIGDLFGDKAGSADSAPLLNDPDRVAGLARLIKEHREDAVIGFPAAGVGTHSDSGRPPLFYAAQTADGLVELLRKPPTAQPGKDQRWTCVMADHFFCLRDAADDGSDAATQYLHRVRRERLRRPQPPAPVAGPPADDILTPEEKTEGWVPLFDGRSFEGWTTLGAGWGVWSIDGGTIHCAGGYSPWLRTVQTYDSFVLRLEFRISSGGNSGVFFRAPLEARASRFGMEMQIRGVRRPTTNTDTTGAIYAALAPREDASLDPGEWNRVEIDCRGPRVKITINDKVVQDFDMSKEPKLKARLQKGCIGLQDHGDEVAFRRIRIRQFRDQ